MKPLVITSLVLSTIMASESSAQKPDTIAKTKDGTPVFTLPRGTTGAEEHKFEKPKVDTFTVKLPGRATPQKFAKDSAARADTLAIRRAAADSGESAVVERIVADTAWVLVTPGDSTSTVISKQVRLVRREGEWVRTITVMHGRERTKEKMIPRGGWASDSAAAAAPPPPRRPRT